MLLFHFLQLAKSSKEKLWSGFVHLVLLTGSSQLNNCYHSVFLDKIVGLSVLEITVHHLANVAR